MSTLWHIVPEDMAITMSWKTDLLSSYLSEQRVKRRITPRLSLSYRGILYGQEVFEVSELAKVAKNSFLVPDYRYAQYVTEFSSVVTTVDVDTDSLYSTAGDQVLFYNDDAYFLATISSVGSDQITLSTGPATPLVGAYVCPVLDCHSVGGLSISQNSSFHASYQLEFTSNSYYDIAAGVTLESYRGYPVYPDRTLVDSAKVEIRNVVRVKDSGFGAVEISDKYDHVDTFESLSFSDDQFAKIFRREAILHNFHGKLKPFWKSSDRNDVALNASASSGSSTITVRTGVTATATFIGRDLCIEMLDGTRYYHRITNCGISSGVATLTISPVLAANLSIASVRTISMLSLYRLAEDAVMTRIISGVRSLGNTQIEYLGNEE